MNTIDPITTDTTTTLDDPDATARSPHRVTARLTDTRLHRALIARRARTHSLAVAGAFVALAVVNTVLDALYARSGFPVPYAEGQTTFDGARVKGFYAVMLDGGTMGYYWATQLFDYVFMAALALFGLTAGSRLVRAAHTRALPRIEVVAAAGAMAVALGAGLDAVENLLSFVMLAQPRSFADWLAVPYSSAAVAKFALVTLGGLGLLIATVATAAAALTGRRR